MLHISSDTFFSNLFFEEFVRFSGEKHFCTFSGNGIIFLKATFLLYLLTQNRNISHFNFIDPSADELRRLMMLHGGQYHVYYSRSKTTHIIATNLPNAKIKELKGEKVVRPEWIMER